jgi:class I fructose-bisphosphate aldolase
MKLTQRVKKILAGYESDNPGTKANLGRILMQGRLGGTGHLVILPVDQGFEHGPARSFAPNPPAYDPHYHWQLAIDAGLSAFAAPLGMIEAGASTFAGSVPTILKVNSANSLMGNNDAPTQAITASVGDALRLGCSAIGYTIYPGSEQAYAMIEDLRELTEEAKSVGLAVVVWSYSRGTYVSKDGETAFDICAYAAHMAALAGAHIIKVKLPTDFLELPAAEKVYKEHKLPEPRSQNGFSMWFRAVLTVGALWYSRAAARKALRGSTRKPGRSGMAAETAQSLAATRSNARKKMPWVCSTL